ncbi:hypothetical protein Y032_0085g1866 [Ancylostoma ceylanicum]|uniref:Uncharacterized protein n=1 Tax=Ancylostoma ceylanicum TaxID=53326 RepID=A0A016TPH7_9BILA|nr:hypothetical protein Y032_0085g1866 [Ancylostoma ceylanicum]
MQWQLQIRLLDRPTTTMPQLVILTSSVSRPPEVLRALVKDRRQVSMTLNAICPYRPSQVEAQPKHHPRRLIRGQPFLCIKDPQDLSPAVVLLNLV